MRERAAVALGGLLLAVGAVFALAQGPVGPTSAAPVVTTLTIFAGAAEGLWRSRDWGGTWEPVEATKGRAAPSGAVRSIHPLGPRVYVGAERHVLVSDDFGETWTALGVPGLVLAVLPSRYPQADPTLFVGTTEGLLKSPDAGRTFDRPALAGIPVGRLEWPGPALVVATGRGVMVSMDGGASFTGPGTGLPEGAVLSIALSSFFVADPVIFAGTVADGVFRSRNGGKTWSPAGSTASRSATSFGSARSSMPPPAPASSAPRTWAARGCLSSTAWRDARSTACCFRSRPPRGRRSSRPPTRASGAAPTVACTGSARA
jgi:photosystem II stability/assembly factor-like uncharacterized protein